MADRKQEAGGAPSIARLLEAQREEEGFDPAVKIEKPTPIATALSRLIVTTTAELVEAVSRLRQQKGVMAHCIKIKQLENEGDVVYHQAIASLFRENLPAIEVIKWKDVYDNMERCIDSCVAVAHVLESVVLKHS